MSVNVEGKYKSIIFNKSHNWIVVLKKEPMYYNLFSWAPLCYMEFICAVSFNISH